MSDPQDSSELDAINNLLVEAVRRNDVNSVADLLSRGADANVRINLNLHGYGDAGTSVLLIALDWPIDHGRDSVSLPVVRALLDAGADIEATGQLGRTALITAVSWGVYDAVRLLLERGAKVNAADHGGESALHLACAAGEPAMVSLLIENGADISARRGLGDTSLTIAINCRQVEVVRLLLKHGADVQKETVLSVAESQRGPLAKIKAMLEEAFSRTERDTLYDALKPFVNMTPREKETAEARTLWRSLWQNHFAGEKMATADVCYAERMTSFGACASLYDSDYATALGYLDAFFAHPKLGEADAFSRVQLACDRMMCLLRLRRENEAIAVGRSLMADPQPSNVRMALLGIRDLLCEYVSQFEPQQVAAMTLTDFVSDVEQSLRLRKRRVLTSPATFAQLHDAVIQTWPKVTRNAARERYSKYIQMRAD